jgi:hypothetical protein
VFEAYSLLEARGQIHCRPRSGYYVNLRKGPQTPEPHTAVPAAESQPVAISDLVFEVLGSTRDIGIGWGDRNWRAPCKGGAFLWVQVPPGHGSSQ